jgi:hypothetical protein
MVDKKRTWTLDPKLLAEMEEELKSEGLIDGQRKRKRRRMTCLEKFELTGLLRRHGVENVGVNKDGSAIRLLNPGWDDRKARIRIAPDDWFLTVQTVRDNRMRYKCFTAKELSRRRLHGCSG